jgi:hypothetical protein
MPEIDSFYSNLDVIHDFVDITNISFFKEVPQNWHIVLTDIKGSTKAIESGRYKDVNMVAASSITALLNLAGDLEIPFVFGGDGVTVDTTYPGRKV